jgi:hypothetical protein
MTLAMAYQVLGVTPPSVTTRSRAPIVVSCRDIIRIN